MTSRQDPSSSSTSKQPCYYRLDVGNLPDELFHNDVPVEKWLDRATTADDKGFANLAELSAVEWDVEVERILCISLYMAGNVLPFVVPSLSVASLYYRYPRYVLAFLLAYASVLYAVEKIYFEPHFRQKYKKAGTQLTKGTLDGTPRENQYVFTERNITKYLSIHFVWPASLHPQKQKSQSLVFCIAPHGVAPMGITAYPLWSKLWNDKMCHWAAAPAILKIPLVRYFVKSIGCIPAKAADIHEALTKRDANVGIVLDGIAGMFQAHPSEERLVLRKRKGIVKIALRAGASLVPVYGFGHTSLWSICVDPFGILERLSNATGVSLVPFYGRFGWFLGPPRRIPVTVCLGDPIECPAQVGEPSKEMIDEYHQKLLDGYQKVFDAHKHAYGWGDKKLKFV